MWKRLATSELLSTFFPTWIWQGREWANGRIPRFDPFYWGHAHAHPVLSTYYPPSILCSIAASKLGLDKAFCLLVASLGLHLIFTAYAWYWLFQSYSATMPALFGAITITFGAYSLKQQPCIIYTLAWFPLTLAQDPVVSSVAVGMMILAGYYPFAIYLLPISILAHLYWYKEAWLLLGFLPGLIQLVPFVEHLPKTIKRIADSCESPEVERRFYVGVIPIMLIPFSTSRIWPLVIVASLGALGMGKRFFPRVHERWLIVVQFGIGWMSVSALENLRLSNTALALLLFVHCFDIWLHNRSCLPPRPYCELWQKPSRIFDTKLTRYLEYHLGSYNVAGLPWPLFTGHINYLTTIGYCGSMQTKEMWSWRKSFRHDPFIDGVDQYDLTKHRIRFAFSGKRPVGWHKTPIKRLYRSPEL